MARILITGAGGFIGRHLLTTPSIDQSSVHALLGPGDPPVDTEITSSVADLRRSNNLGDIVSDIETIIHLAGPSSVSRSFERSREYLETHILGTQSLLRAAGARGELKHFVYVSSAEVYGQPSNNPVTEKASLDPRSPYGAAKAGAEIVIRAAARVLQDVSFVIVRPFVVYGPGMRRNSVVWSVLKQACCSHQIKIADPHPVRDFCFVEDLVSALVKAARLSPAPGVQVFNIGSGIGTSIADLARTAARAADTGAPVLGAKRSDRPKHTDVHRVVADTRFTSSRLDWRATFDLLSGLKTMIERDPTFSRASHV